MQSKAIFRGHANRGHTLLNRITASALAACFTSSASIFGVPLRNPFEAITRRRQVAKRKNCEMKPLLRCRTEVQR